MAALENIEVMFMPGDVFDLPRTVCGPGNTQGMHYLGPFLPNSVTPLASHGYRLSLHIVSQFPGYISPTGALSTSSLLVAQPMVPDEGKQPVVSPVKFDDQKLGQAMTDWIDRPPPNGSAIGTWVFEQTWGLINHPDVDFAGVFELENDPRILSVVATCGEDHGPKYDSSFHYDTGIGVRSYTVTLIGGIQSEMMVATNAPTPGNYYPSTDTPDPQSFTTTDPTGTLIDLIVNARWIDDNLFIVITPKDFGDPAIPVDQGFPEGPFGSPGEVEISEVVAS